MGEGEGSEGMVQALNGRLDMFKQQREDANEELRKSRVDNEAFQRKLQAAEDDKGALQKSLEEAKQQVKDKEAEVQVEAVKTKTAGQKAELVLKQKDELDKKVVALEGELRAAKEIAKTKEGALATKEAALEELEKSNVGLQQELDKEQAEVQRLEASQKDDDDEGDGAAPGEMVPKEANEALEKQLRAKEKDFEGKLKELSKATTSSAALGDEVAKLKIELTQHKTDSAGLKKANEEMTEKYDEMNEQLTEAQGAQRELTSKVAELEMVTGATPTRETLTKEKTKLEQQLKDVNSQFDDLSKKLAAKTAEADKLIDDLVKTKETLTKEKVDGVSGLKQELTDLNKIVAKLEAKLQGSQDLTEVVRKALEDEKQEGQRLVEQLTASTEATRTLQEVEMPSQEQAVAEMKNKMAIMETVTKNSSTRYGRLEERLLSLVQELKNRVQQMSFLNDKVRESEKALAEEKEVTVKLQLELEAAKGTQTTLEGSVEAQTQLTSDAKNRSAELETERVELRQEITDLTNAKEDATTKAEELQEMVDSFDSRLKAKDDRILKIMERLQMIREASKDIKDRVIESEEAQASKGEELTAAQAEADEKQKLIDVLTQELTFVKEELDAVKLDSKKKDIDVQSGADMVQVLKDQVVSISADHDLELAAMKEQLGKSNATANSPDVELPEDMVDKMSSQNEKALQEQVKNMENAMASQQQLIDQLEDNAKKAQADVDAVAVDKGGLEAQLKQALKDIDAKIAAAAAAEEEALLAQKETDDSSERIQALQTDLTTKTSELATAEAKVTTIDAELREIKAAAQAAASTSPAGGESEEAAARLRLKYFQTLALLVKQQLAAHSPASMSNERITEELLGEMDEAGIAVDEWPAYIFSRLFVSA